MTIMPGSLDYLYYNGILDHIPYEAYEMGPVGTSTSGNLPQLGNIKQSVLNGTYDGNMSQTNFNGQNNYLDTAMKGQMYGNYGISNDYFMGSTSYQQNYGMPGSAQMYGAGSSYGGVGAYSEVGNPLAGYGYGTHSAGSSGQFNDYDEMGGMRHERGLINSIKSSTEGVLSSKPWLKGLLAFGIILATPLLLFSKVFKKPPAMPKQKSTFWSKLNPFNWFKKK